MHAQEHDLELSSVRIVIDVFGQCFVNRVSLHRDVYGNTSPQLDNVGPERLNLSLVISNPRQQLQGRLVGREALLLKLQDVVCGGLHLPLQLILVVE